MIYRKLYNSRSSFPKVRVGVTADVLLGAPKNNCHGIGLCRIQRATSAIKSLRSVGHCCKAKALIVEDKGELVFYFIRHTLADCVLTKQFAGGRFKIEEAVAIPNDIAVELGFQLNTCIQEGHYKVVDLGVHLCIAVKVGFEQRITAVAN